MLDMIALYPDVFVGTAVIDPLARPRQADGATAPRRACAAFRIHPQAEQAAAGEVAASRTATQTMFAAGARTTRP